MAVTVLTGRTQAAAVNYNYTTNGSTDWSSVPNSTYFYDLVDKLPHYKNPSGTVLEVFSDFTGGTVGGQTTFSNGLSATTISATTIGSPTDCVDDLYVSNIHSCSPLNINPLDEGEVYFGSTSGVTIDVTNSRLGIGTTTPTELLHLKSAGAARIRIEADTDDTTEPDNAEILISQDGGNTKANISLTPDTNNDLMIGVNAGAGTTPDIRFNTKSDGLTFTTSADTKVIIKNDGKVGIGTDSPSEKLHIDNGNILVQNTNGSYRSDIQNATGPLVLLSGNTTGVSRFGVVVPTYDSITLGVRGPSAGLPGYGNIGDGFIYSSNANNGINIISAPGVGTNDYIRFYAGQDATSTSDIHIQGTGTTRGYVGIGTETPTERLDVNGKTKTTTLQITSGAVNNYVLTSDASGNAAWEPVTNSGALTGITINNNTNNYLLTAIGTANIINGESGARFDGVTLDLTKSSTSPNIIISDAGNTTTDAYIRIESTSAGTPTYAIGVDKSDLNKFKITYANNSTASPGSTKLFDIDYNSALPIYSLAYDSVLFNTAPNAGQIELHDRASSITSSFTQFAGFASLSANNGDTGADYFYINNDSVSGLTSFGGGGVNDQMLLVNENRVDLPGITGGNGLYIKNDLSVNGLVRVGAVTSTGVAVYRNATTGILTTTSSDERVKQNITQITGATEIVKNLTGVYYNWKNTEHFQTEDESRQIGLIAQEVEPHLPEAVVLNGISDYKTIKYSEMVSVLVESIKEQQLIIEDLKQRIINLENK